jgi:hypothetical protein
MNNRGKYTPADKRFIVFIWIIAVLWIWFIISWITSCTRDNHVQIVDNTVDDYYVCLDCEIIEDSTWAETIHWHSDTVCLYSMGMFVGSADTIKCDTVRGKQLRKKFVSYIVNHFKVKDLERIISLVN